MDAQAETTNDRNQRTDLELIVAINGGDSDAFEALYLRYRDWVTALARRFTENDNLALDVLQETFLYFLKKFPGFVLTAQLKTFLYPVVKNLSIAARRKTRRHQSSEAELTALEHAPALEATATDTGDLEIVLAGLPAEQREVLLLRFVDGLSLNEIAEALEIPLGTVKSRLHNALASLRANPRTKSYFEQ